MAEHEDDKRDDHDHGTDGLDEDDKTIEGSERFEVARHDPGQTVDDEGLAEPEPKPDPEPESEAESKAAKPKLHKLSPAEKRSKLIGNLVFVVGFLVTLVAGYFVGQWVRVKFGEQPTPETGDRYRVELRGDEPQRGPDDALVTIIEFADYQCPHCAASVEPLDEAMAAYEGDVRLIFKHYPLPGHRAATPAAYAAWAAHQQGDFWDFHERVFEEKAAFDMIPEIVRERGLDSDQFTKDWESAEARQAVDQDILAGSKVGVTGTPAFFVNGHLYRGKRDEVGWRKIIEAELGFAKELMDDEDLARAELYDHMMKDALERQVGAPDRAKPKQRERRPGEPDGVSTYKVPIAGRPVKGPETALVTIVEFADYHCPYCAKVKLDLDRVLEAHGDEVRLVYVQRPLDSLHPQARDASKAALAAAQQGKFWEMHDLLFIRRLKTMDEFVAAAEELGLDVQQFQADFDSEAVTKQLAADQKLAEKYAINGTPAFFINGRYVSGAQTYGVLETLVEERLAEAKQMVAKGTAPSAIYETLMSTAKTSVED